MGTQICVKNKNTACWKLILTYLRRNDGSEGVEEQFQANDIVAKNIHHFEKMF